MIPRNKVYVIIPTCNEEATIGRLCLAITDMGYKVVVVDSGSTDGTVLRVPVMRGILRRYYSERQSIAVCVLMGIRMALADGAERIVVMDAGGSHQPTDIPVLLNVDADVVVGSRFMKGSRYEGRRWRSLFSRLAALMCRLKTGVPCSDWTSGFRAYSRVFATWLLGAEYKTSMHSWQIETLAAAFTPRRGFVPEFFKLAVVPITYIAGRSSFTLKIALDAFKVWKGLPNARRYR